MKTWLVAFICIVIVAIIGVYVFIPSPLTVSGTIGFHANANGAYRTLAKQESWDGLAPGNFVVSKRLLNTVEAKAKVNAKTYPVSVLFIPKSTDSVLLHWKSELPSTNNPFSRIALYRSASALHDSVDAVLNRFQLYVADVKNVYGATITETSTRDTFLITTRFKTKSFPSDKVIYEHIGQLRSFASKAGAKEVSFPMLNISTTDSTNFSCMVGLPIDRIVNSNRDVSFVRMIPGRFLTTTVIGGPYSIRKAHRMMDQYFKDYNRIAMAIPFEYLVTNRLNESDTSKWETRIYCPVY